EDRGKASGRRGHGCCNRPYGDATADHALGPNPLDEEPKRNETHHVCPQEAREEISHFNWRKAKFGGNRLCRHRENNTVPVIDDHCSEYQQRDPCATTHHKASLSVFLSVWAA